MWRALLVVAMETGPVQVEPLAGIFSVTWGSLDEDQWRKWCFNIRVNGEFVEKLPSMISL